MGELTVFRVIFDNLQAHPLMHGRLWLLSVLVFRALTLRTVASDLFDDEQKTFACNTLQPGCKQVCYDAAFPFSLYKFWVFHIVVIATHSMGFLMYVVHRHNKRNGHSYSSQGDREDLRLKRLYVFNVALHIVAEFVFLVSQGALFGSKVEAHFSCSSRPCLSAVDCYTSRPAEKSFLLQFFFIVGLISVISSGAELLYNSRKWFFSSSSVDPLKIKLEEIKIIQRRVSV